VKEADQLHRRNCFTPVDVATLTPEEKRKAAEALMLLSEKRDQTVKGRLVHQGDQTQQWFNKEDVKSPTVSQEAIFLTAIIDAHENRDVLRGDVPNAFIQTTIPNADKAEERIIMKITGVLVDYVVDIAPELCGPYIVFENGKKVLYLQVLRITLWDANCRIVVVQPVEEGPGSREI
jgi:hypothetical protein